MSLQFLILNKESSPSRLEVALIMTKLKKSLLLLPLLIALNAFCAMAQAPRLFFTDLDSGPNAGGENVNGFAGAYVTLYGNFFGSSQGSSTVTWNGLNCLRRAPTPDGEWLTSGIRRSSCSLAQAARPGLETLWSRLMGRRQTASPSQCAADIFTLCRRQAATQTSEPPRRLGARLHIAGTPSALAIRVISKMGLVKRQPTTTTQLYVFTTAARQVIQWR